MSGTLVDTSVWVDHFRHGNRQLANWLELDFVYTHPMIVAEVACGTLPNRTVTLQALGYLRPVQQASWFELRRFIEQHRLYGRGCGVVALTLLVSTLLTPGVRLWTLDKRLAALAREIGVQSVSSP